MANEKTRRFLKEEFYGWRCNETVLGRYLNCCRDSVMDNEHFKKFKKNASYTPILEHVTKDQSNEYLQNILDQTPELAYEIEDKFSINDSIGGPTIMKYTLPNGQSLESSPTTIRYVKVLSDLMKLFGDLGGLKIVEIGGGYGGLATVIKQQFSFDHYYDVDLKWPGNLAKKYTSTLDIKNFTSITPGNLDKIGDVDLVISNYAFSECNLETREEYIDKILSKAKMGYITHNGDQQRRDETKSIIENYNGFEIYGYDGAKKHPIFIWNKTEEAKK